MKRVRRRAEVIQTLFLPQWFRPPQGAGAEATRFRRAPWGQKNRAGRWQRFGVQDLSTILEGFKGDRH
jgi:hypothetical protein